MRGSSFVAVSVALAISGCCTLAADPAPADPSTGVIHIEQLGQVVAPIDTSAIMASSEMNITNACAADCPKVTKPQRLSVIDGEPYSRELGRRAIDPDDIIGVTVFSGRDGAAMYGARARDGLVVITTAHPMHLGCRPAPDTSATAIPPEFIQIDGPDICGKYDDYVFVVNGVLLDATRAEKCFVSVDPSAIATIDILKPAAAASVYGAKAARGAVVVTLNDGIESPCDP